MHDENKNTEQLLSELKELRQEVERLRFLEAQVKMTDRAMAPGYEDLEKRLAESMGWF